ncbi:pre-tRNA nuclear export protein, partial [Coemansia nantahalensis]
MEQVEEAVRCALDPESPPEVKTQATEYCEQVKRSPHGWRVCLELFTAAPERGPEARLFALQAIEAAVAGADGAPETLETIRAVLLDFVSTQYAGSRYQAEPGFIKNTLAHAVTLLGLAMYPARWPTFIEDMVKLAGMPGTSGPVSEDSVAGAGSAHINPGLADFLMKVLGSLDEEMVNRVVPRAAGEAARNTEIKDAMRVTDVSRMAHAWYAILGSLSGSHPDLSRGVLRLMGVYAAWIDINLVVNQPFMRILFELLQTPALRCAACHCLAEIVGKGMRATDKLQLLRFIGIVGTMKHLEIGDVEFGEQVGRLANVTGIELNAILVDRESATAET